MLNHKHLNPKDPLRELKLKKYTTHTKGHYGIEDPKLKFSKKGYRRTHIKGTKLQETQSTKRHGDEE